MSELRNISIQEYLQLKNTSEYDFYSGILKAENKLCGKKWDTSSMTFNEYHTIISIMNNPKFEDIQELFVHLYNIKGNIYKSPLMMFFEEKIFQFWKAQRFVQEFIQEKIDFENKVLYSEPDGKMIETGAYDLIKPYAVMLTKVQIAEQFGKEPEEVGNWKYSRVLNIMAVNNLRNNIQKKL